MPTSHASGAAASSATPIGAHQIRPAWSRPLPVKSPGFGAISVSVSSATTDARPSGWPRSTSRPDGTSTASTRAPRAASAAMRPIAAASSPSGARAPPMPRSASITSAGTSSSSLVGAPLPCQSRSSIPAAAARASARAASAGGCARAPTRSTVVRLPNECSRVAASMPSPPLLPGPAKTTIRSACGASASASRATASPARAISVNGATAASAARCACARRRDAEQRDARDA